MWYKGSPWSSPVGPRLRARLRGVSKLAVVVILLQVTYLVVRLVTFRCEEPYRFEVHTVGGGAGGVTVVKDSDLDAVGATVRDTSSTQVAVCIMTNGHRLPYLLSTIHGLHSGGFTGTLAVSVVALPNQTVDLSRLNRTLYANLTPSGVARGVRLRLLTKERWWSHQQWGNNLTEHEAIQTATKVNYWTCLQQGSPDQGVLVLQDDIAFCPYFWYLLHGFLASVSAHLRHFVLSLYVPRDYDDEAGSWPRLRPGVMLYPPDRFYGTQALYFPPPVKKTAAAYLYHEVMSGPVLGFDDVTLMEFVGGRREGFRRLSCTRDSEWCPRLLATSQSLVQHVGARTTLSGHGSHAHNSSSFLETLRWIRISD